ncbi:MAG: glycerate kinase [Sulfolobales archaeon]
MIKNFDELASSELRSDALRIIEAGLQAADPVRSIKNVVRLEGSRLVVGGKVYDIGSGVKVLGFGKASASMALAVEEVLGDLIIDGIVIVPKGLKPPKLGRIKVMYGSHPIPDEDTINSTKELLRLCSQSEGGTFIVLISGGGSALFELPVEPITLNDLRVLTTQLLKCGADIKEINTVRKHVSMVKGGRLAELLYPSNVVSLILSDVVGDPIEFIASGPTAPDPTTYDDAVKLLKRYEIFDSIPASVREVLMKGLRGELRETPKPGDKIFDKVLNYIVASNYISLKAMEEEARRLGYNTLILTSMVEGEAREVGKLLAGVMKNVKKYDEPVRKPAAILAGGETTVTVRGKGIGGRNQELALSVAISIAGLDNVVFASIGSDGVDGVSVAAGGIVDGETVIRGRELGLNPYDFLNNNDSYNYLSRLGSSILTGPTGTNVNDLLIALIR